MAHLGEVLGAAFVSNSVLVTSKALVSNSFLLLEAMHLFLVAVKSLKSNLVVLRHEKLMGPCFADDAA